MQRFTFKKEERLCSKTSIDELFTEGKSLFVYPFKLLFTVDTSNQNTSSPVQVLFSVPKRSIKHAVKRNQIRRRAKEAYRLNKNSFIEQLGEKNIQLQLIFIYIEKEAKDYKTIEKGIKKALNKLIGVI